MKRVLLLLSLLPLTAHAEVMDKEASDLSLCSWATVSAAFAFLAARHRPWLLLFLSVPMLFFLGQIVEILDPQVGPAMAREAGAAHIALWWAAPALVFAGGFWGLELRRRAAGSVAPWAEP